MPDKAWKVAERFIAKAFGVERSLKQGKAVADVEIPGFSVESKETKRIPAAVLAALDQARRNVLPGKRPLLVMYQPRKNGPEPIKPRRIVVMEFADFLALHERAYANDGGGAGRAPDVVDSLPGPDGGAPLPPAGTGGTVQTLNVVSMRGDAGGDSLPEEGDRAFRGGLRTARGRHRRHSVEGLNGSA